MWFSETLGEHDILKSYKNNQTTQFNSYPNILRWRAQHERDALSYCFLKDGRTEAESFTYSQLDRKVRALASHLQGLHSEQERALLILENDLNYLIAFFACLYSKTIAVTLHPPSSKEQLFRLQQVIKDCNPKFVLSTSAIYEKLNSSDQWTEKTIQWIEIDQISQEQEASWVMPDIKQGDLAFLQYTSGSTSSPKGVMVSHRNLICQGEYIQKAMSMTKQDIAVTWLPLFHDMGLILGALQGIYTGYPTYIMKPLSFVKSPLVWLEAISKYGGTITAAPNFAYDLCCEAWSKDEVVGLDLRTLECALNGAEPVRQKTLDNFISLFRPYGFRPEAFYPAYGMAETTLVVSGGNRGGHSKTIYIDAQKIKENQISLISSVNQAREVFPIVSCGKSHLEACVKIVDPKSLRICPNFVVGEIYVKGDSVTLGYWKNHAATKESFGIFFQGEGPFFKTGDLGFLDGEGEVYISGRCKDVIIINGRNHAPQDIELTVQESHSAILSNFVGAFSVNKEDKERLIIVAAIKKNCIQEVDVPEIFRSIRQKIASIHAVEVEDILLIRRGDLPKTTSGKIQRSLCRSKYISDGFTPFYKHSLNCSLKKVS